MLFGGVNAILKVPFRAFHCLISVLFMYVILDAYEII